MSGESVTISASIPKQVEIVNISSDATFDDDENSQDNTNSTVRRSKAERKQKLQVRSDDSQDMFDLLTDNNDDHKEEFISSSTPSPSSDTNNTNSFRAARRQIRVKKVFDPSDNFIIKKKRSRQPKTKSTKPKTKSNSTIPQETVIHSQNNSPKISEVILKKIIHKRIKKREIDPKIPDVRNWSVETVYLFFSRYFPLNAHIFKDHEIDGEALLLLTRKLIIERLVGLGKLGLALKIHKQVVILQARYDDPALYWLKN